MVIKKRLKAHDIEKLENTSFAAVGGGAGGAADRIVGAGAADSWSYCPSSDSCNCASHTCAPTGSASCSCASDTCCCGVTACATNGLTDAKFVAAE